MFENIKIELICYNRKEDPKDPDETLMDIVAHRSGLISLFDGASISDGTKEQLHYLLDKSIAFINNELKK